MTARPAVITTAERRRRMATRHLLAPAARVDRLDRVSDSLVGLHASDPVTVFLAAAARLRAGDTSAIERALYDERSVVRHHAMRRTLWAVSPDVARVAHAAATVRLVVPERTRLVRMLAENDVDDADRWLDDAVASTLEAIEALGGLATARELGEAVPALRAPLAMAPGKPYASTVAAHTRVLTLMGFMGDIVRGRPVGSWVSGQYRWAVADRWIDGGLGSLDSDAASAELVDRYLRAFGPASLADVQWWTGWTKRITAAALAAAGAVAVVDERGHDLHVAGDDVESETSGAGDEPWVAVLPGLDPTIMGWKDRDWYLPDAAHAAGLYDRNGNAGPSIWADGRVVGGWMQRRDGSIAHELFEPLPARHRDLLDTELDRVTRFLGDRVVTIRFPTPLSKRLGG